MAASRFIVGSRVNHPAAPDGMYPSGYGTVVHVSPISGPWEPPVRPAVPPLTNYLPPEPGSPATGAYLYAVRSDLTGEILPARFHEGDLKAA